MSEDFIALGQVIFSGVWGLFSVEIPGLGISAGTFTLGVFLLSVSLSVARVFFGVGGHVGGETPRSGSTRNPRISEKRRHDEF